MLNWKPKRFDKLTSWIAFCLSCYILKLFRVCHTKSACRTTCPRDGGFRYRIHTWPARASCLIISKQSRQSYDKSGMEIVHRMYPKSILNHRTFHSRSKFKILMGCRNCSQSIKRAIVHVAGLSQYLIEWRQSNELTIPSAELWASEQWGPSKPESSDHHQWRRCIYRGSQRKQTESGVEYRW